MMCRRTEDLFFYECGEHKLNENHMTTRGPVLYVVGRLSSQLFHITYFQSKLAGRYHMVNDKNNKKLMKRPVPVNMLLKRVFLLSAESS